MKKPRSTSLLLVSLALAVMLPPPAGASGYFTTKVGRTTEDKSNNPRIRLSATLETISPPSAAHGTPLQWLTLHNADPANRRNLRVTASYFSTVNAIRDIELEGGETVRIPLPTPFAEDYCANQSPIEGIVISECGGGASAENKLLDLAPHTFHLLNTYYPSHCQPVLLIAHAPANTRNISPERLRAALSFIRLHPSNSRLKRLASESKDEFPCQVCQCTLPPDQWPDDYRAYLTYDGVILTEENAAALTQATREALSAFERLGGTVLTTAVDEHGEPFADLAAAIRARTEIVSAFNRLDGHCDHHDLPIHGGFNELLKQIPLPVTGSLPVNLISLLLALFALVAVPAILIVCSRRNRRLGVLIALPAAAISLTAVIIGISLAVFGLTPTVRVQSIAWLDQGRREAVARGRIAVFSPVPLDGELTLPSDVGFRPRHTHSGTKPVLRLGEPMRGCEGWFNPLEAAFFEFDRRSHQSERLAVTRLADGRLRVTNLLGADLLRGEINLPGDRADAHGIAPVMTASLGAIAAGASVELAVTNGISGLRREAVSDATDWGRSWPKLVQAVAGGGLAPTNGYAVIVAGSPFLPPPLGERQVNDHSETLVIGTFGEERAK